MVNLASPILRCPSCGVQYRSPNRYGANTVIGGSNANAIVESCPQCGGRVPVIPDHGDGTYAVGPDGSMRKVRHIARALRSTDAADLRALAESMETARSSGDTNAARGALERGGLGFLLDRDARMEIWTIVGLVLMTITLLLQMKTARGDEELTPGDIDEVCKIVSSEAVIQADQTKRTVQRVTTYQVGRNERCPCGSGHKFKYCHGAPPGLSRQHLPSDDRQEGDTAK